MAIKDPSFDELREKGRRVGRLAGDVVYDLDGRWYSVDEYPTEGRIYYVIVRLDPWEYELVDREAGVGEGEVSGGTRLGTRGRWDG
jgi:hypothetical protein